MSANPSTVEEHIFTLLINDSLYCIIVFVLNRVPPCGAHHVCDSVLSAVRMLSDPPFADTVEQIFVLGGTEVYRVNTLFTCYNIFCHECTLHM